MRVLTCLLFCALTLPATAQTVWRCGTDGRTFTDRPCVDGQEHRVDASVPAAALAEAREVRERERLALQRLAQERRARESEAQLLAPAGIQRAALPAEAAEPPRHRKSRRRPAPEPSPDASRWVSPRPRAAGGT
ncbi:MAG: DUF4124 domain-containing protein [Rubrivivax sp.]|nr:DUF4124 domain-containing protein [Rubrivivax sp.]MDH5338885.1 DUF4124 domain-containing protein [Rubrivivax sp.]